MIIKTKKNRLKAKEALSGYLFILPNAIGLIIFYILPIVITFAMAFTSWDGLGNASYIGVENFKKLFQEPSFYYAIRNTFIYAFATVPLIIVFSTVASVALNSSIRFIKIYRTLFFLPSVTMSVAIAVIWKQLFNSDYGVINAFLSCIGLNGPNWISDPHYILISVIVIGVWAGIAPQCIILVSGLQAIPGVYYEAAKIDGSNAVQNFFHITLPLLTPSLFFVLTTGLIGAFQMFDYVFVMLGSGGVKGSITNSVRTLVYNVYIDGFKTYQFGYASAEALILFIIIVFVTVFQFKYQKKWVYYE